MNQTTHMVNSLIRKINIIGIISNQDKQRFLIAEKAKLMRVKRCVKRNSKVHFQKLIGTLSKGKARLLPLQSFVIAPLYTAGFSFGIEETCAEAIRAV